MLDKGVTKNLANDLHIDMNDMDGFAVSLTAIAHDMTVIADEDEQHSACLNSTGRALKHLIPGWITFLKDERDRATNGGTEYGDPATAVYGVSRSMAFLLSMGVLGFCNKDEDSLSVLRKTIIDLVSTDIGILCGDDCRVFSKEETN